MILLIKTDNPQAELYIYKDSHMLAKDVWVAERKLATELLPHIEALLKKHNLEQKNLTGIAVFTGSGSFTGLRIGTTVANTLAYSLNVPIVSGEGDDWQKQALGKLAKSQNEHIVVPKYDRPANITKPKS